MIANIANIYAGLDRAVSRLERKVNGIRGAGLVNLRDTLTIHRQPGRSSRRSEPVPVLFQLRSSTAGTTMYGGNFANPATRVTEDTPTWGPFRIVDPAGGSAGTTLDVRDYWGQIPTGTTLRYVTVNLAESGMETHAVVSGDRFFDNEPFTFGAVMGVDAGLTATRTAFTFHIVDPPDGDDC